MKNTFLIVAIGLSMAAFWYLYTPEKATEGGLTVEIIEPIKEEVVEIADEESVTNYEISVEATSTSAYVSVLTIRTNIPLPVEVMASVSIKDQKPTDTYIGVSKRVKLTSPEQTVTLDGESEQLPAGSYIAEVTFYPRWGAKNGPAKAMEIKEEIVGTVDIRLTGSGENKSQADQRNIDQIWVMENVIIGTKWNEGKFIEMLGQFSKSKAALNFHDAYYFPRADMTIIVNRLKDTVAIWRMGKATK